MVYDKLKRFDDLVRQMREAIRLNPKHAEALNYLGYTYAERGINLDEAEGLIKRALEIRPKDGYITDSLGWVYFQRGDLPRAVEWLRKAVELAPEDATIVEHLGDAYVKSGDRERGLSMYERALGLEHKDEPQKKEELREKIRKLREQNAGQRL